MTRPQCSATREAVLEYEEKGYDCGCPICGRAADAHPSEIMAEIKRAAYDAKVREMREAGQ